MKPMEIKQTAVEWLEQQLNPDLKTMQGHIMQDLFEQAKQMEKRQMFDFAKGFYYYGNGPDAGYAYDSDVEKFYNKTYGKRGN